MSQHMILDLLAKQKSPAADGVIYLTRHGSRAYGTNIEGSDSDFKGIAIPPKEYYLSCSKKFEQEELSEPDTVIYELRKFLTLLSNNNPNTIECLFTDPSDHQIVSKAGQELLNNRDIFLSKMVRWSFGGYAYSQLKKIETHRKYLLNPLTVPPERKDFGLKEKPEINKGQLDATLAMVQKDLDRINFDFIEELQEPEKIGLRHMMGEMLAEWKITSSDRWLSTVRKLGFDDNFILILQKEKEYMARQREWAQYMSWKQNRNPKRAEGEAKFGFDQKNALHLIRLLRMCEEVLLTGKVNVRREDAQELISIRQGAWTYEQVIQEASALNKRCDIAFGVSKLPPKPDRNKIDALSVRLIEQAIF